jgi:hypothetical protein
MLKIGEDRWAGTEGGDDCDKFNEGNVCSGVLLLRARVKQARKCREQGEKRGIPDNVGDSRIE